MYLTATELSTLSRYRVDILIWKGCIRSKLPIKYICILFYLFVSIFFVVIIIVIFIRHMCITF